MSTTEKTPFFKKKPFLIGAGVVVAFVIAVASVDTSKRIGTVAPSGTAGPAGDKSGLGSAGQTSEFNQTYAARLREQMTTDVEGVRKDLQTQLDAKFTTQDQQLRNEIQKGNEELAKKLELLEQATRQRVEAPPPVDPNNQIRFVMPGVRPDPQGGVLGMTPQGQMQPAQAVAPQAQQVPATRKVVPPNGHVNGRLLNGVVATLGEQPTAFLVALEGSYKAANGHVVDLNGCTASVEGRPNLGAGRIEGKPAQITCIFDEDGKVQTWDVSGWIVDRKDGIRGLSAEIVDNSGKKIKDAMLAGAISTAGAAFKASQYTTTPSASGYNQSMTGSAGNVVAGGLVEGAGQGFQNAVNEHFSLYKPSLQKGGGAPVTLVLTNELPVPTQGDHISSNTNLAPNR